MLTLDPPVFVSVTVCDCCAPTTTSPKISLAGLGASWPEEAAAPVPASETSVTVSEASLVMAAVALKVPVAFGVNLMLIGALCPAATVMGKLGAVTEKYWVEMEIPLTVTDAGPEFETVSGNVLLVPAATLPKPRLKLPTESVVVCCWLDGPPALTPWQPANKAIPERRTKTAAAHQRFLPQTSLAPAFPIVSQRTVALDSLTA